MAAGVVEAATAERVARARRGAALCREAISGAVTRSTVAKAEESRPDLTRSEVLLRRAQDRANAERHGWPEPPTRALVCLECLGSPVEPATESREGAETLRVYVCPCGNSWTTRWRGRAA